MPNIRPLNAELQKAAKEQLFEDPDRIAADLEALKTWIQQQPHLKARTDDQFLIAFLRGCKYSLEKTKSKIDKYYMLRSKYPNFFCTHDVDDKRFREIVNLGVVLYLPKPLPNNGPRLAIMRYSTYSPSEHKIEELTKVMNAMQDIIIMDDDYAIINGVAFVMDFHNATAAHLFQMTLKDMKRSNVYGEEALPLRPKAYHILNTIPGFEPLFNMVKPLMSEKQQKRLYVHGNKMESIYEHVPKEYLPIEYGGTNGTFENVINYWNNKFDEYREFFKEEANYGTNEKLRPGKPIDFDGLFGTEGSFRKLDVD